MAAKNHEAFRIDQVDQIRLHKAATELGKPPSTLIREIIVRWLDQRQIEAERRQKAA